MIKDFFTANIWIKIISLLFSIALWFFVVGSRQTESVMNVHILFENMPAGLKIVHAPETVSVGVMGYKRLVEDLGEKDITIVLNMDEARKGRNIFPISESNVKLPKTLTVKSIFPQTITLVLEEGS
ncbi:MAG: hypothetical protein HY809_06715 [Nitrospirae bacterium]|nr:hypothetical protein [Nitrospirota bacterium]